MLHVENNLFFGRLENGDVRVIKFRSVPDEWPRVTYVYPPLFLLFDFVVPAGMWASVVASVSQIGEGDGRFYKAQAFHMNRSETPS